MERLQHYKTALESQFVVLDDFLGQGYWGLSMLMEMVMINIMLIGPSSGHGLDLGDIYWAVATSESRGQVALHGRDSPM